MKLKTLPLNPEEQQWLRDQVTKVGLEVVTSPERVNPCVGFFGRGPEGATCKTCKHLFRKVYSRTYLKCAFRKNTNGKGTDHKARWPACAKYEVEA